MSSYIANKLTDERTKFIIVDRDTRKFKLDKHFKDRFLTFREKMDMADFDLPAFLHHKEIEGKIYCVAKHLCGGATDMALTSILQKKDIVNGIAIATCCHHCCDLKTFCNLDFLLEHFSED